MDDISVELLNRFREGDESAADEVFHRYLNRLIALARSRLSNRLAARIDPEDVVQSAYRSFFQRAAEGQFHAERSGDLWRLLATITVNKVAHKGRFHRRQKRNVLREHSPSQAAEDSNEIELFIDLPTETEAIAVIDELEQLMQDVDDKRRRVLELRLQGLSLDEIATEIQRSERTVRRLLDEMQQSMQKRLFDVTEDDPDD